MLLKPATTVAGRPAVEYEQELKDGGYDVEIPDIEAPAAVRVRRRSAFHGAAALAPDLSDEGEADEAPAVARALVVPSSSSSSGSGSSSTTSSSSMSLAPAAVVAPEALAPDVPDGDDEVVLPDIYFWQAGGSGALRSSQRSSCSLLQPPIHVQCRKLASLDKWIRVLGPTCAQDVLSTWLSRAGDTSVE